jgi:hypothetical protein
VDVECAEAERRIAELPRNVVVLRAPGSCDDLDAREAAIVVTRAASTRDWKTLRSRRWETTAAFWHRAGAR